MSTGACDEYFQTVLSALFKETEKKLGVCTELAGCMQYLKLKIYKGLYMMCLYK